MLSTGHLYWFQLLWCDCDAGHFLLSLAVVHGLRILILADGLEKDVAKCRHRLKCCQGMSKCFRHLDDVWLIVRFVAVMVHCSICCRHGPRVSL